MALWARAMARRRVMSMVAYAAEPTHHLADLDGALVDRDTGHRLLDVADLDDGAGVQLDPAGVGELAAALGVERGAVQDDLDLVALMGGGRRDAVDQQADDGGLALGGGCSR